jgi:hypothetical protein
MSHNAGIKNPLSFYLAKGGKRWLFVGKKSLVLEGNFLQRALGRKGKYPNTMFIFKKGGDDDEHYVDVASKTSFAYLSEAIGARVSRD